MKEDDILNLIHRSLSGDGTTQEDQALKGWLEEDKKHRKYFNAIKKVWDVNPGHDVEVDFEEEWRRISSRLDIDLDQSGSAGSKIHSLNGSDGGYSKDGTLKYLVRVAAVILIVGFSAFYFLEYGDTIDSAGSEGQMAMQKVETAWGEKARMEFSDGSKIMLNAMSSVRFPKEFKGEKREVYLEGEAFFRIKQSENTPFVVHSNGVAVRVLGTEFNVSSYEEGENVEVVVKEGRVAVKQNQPNQNKGKDLTAGSKKKHPSQVVLTKGQRTSVKVGALPSDPENVSLKPYLAWVNGRMVFEGTPLRDVIPKLKRAYNLNFEVQDSSMLSERLKASFQREGPEKVLGVISFSLGIDYQLNGDTVIFKSKTKKNQ